MTARAATGVRRDTGKRTPAICIDGLSEEGRRRAAGTTGESIADGARTTGIDQDLLSSTTTVILHGHETARCLPTPMISLLRRKGLIVVIGEKTKLHGQRIGGKNRGPSLPGRTAGDDGPIESDLVVGEWSMTDQNTEKGLQPLGVPQVGRREDRMDGTGPTADESRAGQVTLRLAQRGSEEVADPRGIRAETQVAESRTRTQRTVHSVQRRKGVDEPTPMVDDILKDTGIAFPDVDRLTNTLYHERQHGRPLGVGGTRSGRKKEADQKKRTEEA